MTPNHNIPDFSVVEIEVNSLCNRSCSYCPVSILQVPDTPRYMSMNLFNKIMDELGEIKYSGLLSYHLYNEPLMRKDLDTLVRTASQKVPQAFQLLFTNGDLLSDEKYQLLIDAGINHFLVTRHDNTPIKDRFQQTIQYSKDLILSNRGGLLKEVEIVQEALNTPCYSPTDNLVITSSGDILLCCDDAGRKEVMGNVLQSSISEVWFSKRFENLRGRLSAGSRGTASELCKKCNNIEYSTPKGNYYTYIAEFKNQKNNRK